MALTKITGQVVDTATDLVVGVTTVGGGLSATDGFFSGIVTAVGDASFSGNVSVGGTLTYEDVTNIDAVGLVTARNGIVVGSGITLSKDGDGFFTGVVTATSYYGDGSNLSNITSTTINTNANNRLVTGSATANTLNAETNLTFDGNTLSQSIDADNEGITINASGNNYSRILGNSNRNAADDNLIRIDAQWNGSDVGRIAFLAGGDTTNKDDGEIAFYTSNTGGSLSERLRIFQNGSVVIGSKSGEAGGSAKLAIDCEGLDINDGVGDAANYGLIFANDPSTDKANGIGFFNDSATTCGGYIVHQDKGSGNIGDIVMATSASSDTPVERLRIASAGDVTVSTGNLVIGTAGKGIDFGVTSNASGSGASGISELLDDYEEGDLTFTVTGSNGGSITYDYRTGHYTRVGNVCHVTGDIRFTSGWSGSDGDAYISLPFTSEETGGCVGGGIVSEWNLTSSQYVGLMIKVDNNESIARVTAHDGGNNNTTQFQTDYLGSGRYLKFAFTYQCQ